MNTELCCVTSQNTNGSGFFGNTMQQSLGIAAVDAYMGWLIRNLQQVKRSDKTPSIPFSEFILVYLWMIWWLSWMDQSDSKHEMSRCVSWAMEKLIFSVHGEIFKNHCEVIFCEKLRIFCPDALPSSSHCRWDMIKLIWFIWYEEPKDQKKE